MLVKITYRIDFLLVVENNMIFIMAVGVYAVLYPQFCEIHAIYNKMYFFGDVLSLEGYNRNPNAASLHK